jgi:hypothetical protein
MSRIKCVLQNHGVDCRFLSAARIAAALLLMGCGIATLPASAATVFFSGTSSDAHPISGSIDFTVNGAADTITVKLTNTTATTLDAGELFTGLDFTVGGLNPTMASTADTGIQRTVVGDGTFSDTGLAQNLTWQLDSLGGGTFQLNFNPDAKDSIIGPPSGGNYAGATGSIKGNGGHNPFAAEMAQFVLNVPNLEDNTPVVAKVVRFGTTLDAATVFIPDPTGDPVVPEPASWILLSGCAALALRRWRSVK